MSCSSQCSARICACSQLLFTTGVQNSTLVHNCCSELTVHNSTLVDNFCSQLIFTTFSPNFCLQVLFIIFIIHNLFLFVFMFTTQLLPKTCVQHSSFTTQILFTTFVHNSCSQYLYNFCSQLFFKTQLLFKLLFTSLVHNFC